jgi:hypothetical protein
MPGVLMKWILLVTILMGHTQMHDILNTFDPDDAGAAACVSAHNDLIARQLSGDRNAPSRSEFFGCVLMDPADVTNIR